MVGYSYENVKLSDIPDTGTRRWFYGDGAGASGMYNLGHDLQEARSMAQDAISAYLASLEKHHEAVPSDDYLLTSVELTYATPA